MDTLVAEYLAIVASLASPVFLAIQENLEFLDILVILEFLDILVILE